jgi:hypothetical protein
MLGHDACYDVTRAAGWEWDNHRNRSNWIALRLRKSITSSARASRVGGTSMPSAFAVFKLMTSSYFDARNI